MSDSRYLAILLFMFVPLSSCHNVEKRIQNFDENKIKFDYKSLDDNGLVGSVDGKRSISYEFCLPNDIKLKRAVMVIDSSLKFQQGRGRSNCSDKEILAIGNTHQAQAQRVLENLASLDYIREISETYWE